jgi:dTDP-4-amino-4,6-dideoxygalactose transaminase
VDELITPFRAGYSDFHIYNQYTLASPHRERILRALGEAKIGHCVYYPIPFHKQPCFADLGYERNACPVSAKAADEVFSIPIFPELTQNELDEVVSVILKALA